MFNCQSYMRASVWKWYLTFLLIAAGIAPAENTNTVAERLKTDPFMMPCYNGRILPEPRQAEYGADFCPLDKAGILLGKGVEASDARLALLLERITQYGGAYEFIASPKAECSTMIAVGDTPFAAGLDVPKRSEGYAIKSFQDGGRRIIVLQGHDVRGLLWALISLKQLITARDGRCVARAANVSDYPGVENRFAELMSDWTLGKGQTLKDAARYLLNYKANMLLRSYIFLFPRYPNLFRAPGSESATKAEAQIRELGAFATPLGVDWFIGFAPYLRYGTQFRSSSEEDYRYFMYWAKIVGEAGGSLAFYWEDYRPPLAAEDKARFGTMKEADLYFFNRIYKDCRAQFPRMKFIVCPVFYWGPKGGMAAWYKGDDDRDEYLKAFGERLPKDFMIFWTGPRVKSYKYDKEDMQWITNLIQRKPIIWQNGVIDVNEMDQLTEPVEGWKTMHYPGFFDDIAGYKFNANRMGAFLIGNLDCLWNVEGYDAKRSVRQAVEKLAGPDAFASLDRARELLANHAKYNLAPCPKAAQDIDRIEKDVAEAEVLCAAVVADKPAAAQWLNTAVVLAPWKKFIKDIRANKTLLRYRNIGNAIEDQAKQDGAFIAGRDIVIAPFNLSGGHEVAPLVSPGERRYATWIYGSKSKYPRLEATFEAIPYPPEGACTVIIRGQAAYGQQPCRMQLALNGKAFFEGPSPFKEGAWSTWNFVIPDKYIERYNKLTVQLMDDSAGHRGPPYLLVNYIVIRPARL